MKKENQAHLLRLWLRINTWLPETNTGPSAAHQIFANDRLLQILLRILIPNLQWEWFENCSKVSWWRQADLQFSVPTDPAGDVLLKSGCFYIIFLVAWVLCYFGTTWSWRWHPSSWEKPHHKQTSWSLLKVSLQLQSALLPQVGHLLHSFSSGLLLLHKTTSAWNLSHLLQTWKKAEEILDKKRYLETWILHLGPDSQCHLELSKAIC